MLSKFALSQTGVVRCTVFAAVTSGLIAAACTKAADATPQNPEPTNIEEGIFKELARIPQLSWHLTQLKGLVAAPRSPERDAAIHECFADAACVASTTHRFTAGFFQYWAYLLTPEE